jgi:hypothetical protein
MDLTLTNQASQASTIQTRINTLKSLMDSRLPIWKKLPDAKKKAWVTSGKDPIMTLAWNVYKYLRDNFFDSGVDNG